MQKRARKAEFTAKTRRIIEERDNGCIFCQMHYRMEKANWMDLNTFSIMHFVSRAAGGLGIEQNAAVGCFYHHTMLDNGNGGHREEMLKLFEEYLRSLYDDWDINQLKYNKWGFLNS